MGLLSGWRWRVFGSGVVFLVLAKVSVLVGFVSGVDQFGLLALWLVGLWLLVVLGEVWVGRVVQ